MMTRMVAGLDMLDGWVVVQKDVYRYSIIHSPGVVVRSVMFEMIGTETAWNDC